jgi:putative ABC transport system permease protein
MDPMDVLLQDARYALRAFARNPGFVALTVACLSLGIGVNSAVFSIVNSILRPLPFANPESLVAVHGMQPSNGIDFGNISYPAAQDLRANARTISDLAVYTGRSLTFADTDEPERVSGYIVSANLFPMLGIQPILGRQFTTEDDRVGAAGVVILSYGLWQRRYAGDPSVIGRSIMLNGAQATVIGVMPLKFAFPEIAAAWIPLDPIEHASPRTARNLEALARLRDGATTEQTRQELAAIGARLAQQHADDTGWSISIQSLNREFIPDDVRLVIFTMMGAVSLVLIIACANVANLLLARASTRQREIAVRSALGAGRRRIVRQLLTESVLIAAASIPLGVVISYIGLKLLDSAIPAENQIPYYIDWSLNGRVVLYTVVIALATGFVFGLAPALHANAARMYDGLKDGGRMAAAGARRNWLRSALVVAEVALSLVLLVGASLFIRTFVNLERTDVGFDTKTLMTMRFYMPGATYDEPSAMERRVDDIVRRVEALPGVTAATSSNLIPLGSGGDESGIVAEGTSYAPGEVPNVRLYGVTAHFFRTVGLGMVAGRDFTDAEGVGRSGVAIVSQLMAKRIWPKTEDVIGRRFRLDGDATGQWITVIGVVADVKIDGVRRRSAARAFMSYAYSTARNTGLTIRAAAAPASIARAVRDQVHASDPTLPVFAEQTMDQVRALSFWQYGLFGWMFSIFGGIALVLAAVGVYGVLSYAVSQRTSELGVRVALGASRGSVFGLILGDGVRLAALGIGCGIVGAFGVTRVITSLLYDVSASDPLSFGAAAAFLVFVALAASYVPARRATAVDPMIALRAE